jgi:hypothetical protein
MMVVWQVRHLDAIGVEAIGVDQPLGQHQRLGRAVRSDVNLALETLETMPVGIQEILVEGDAITVHLVLLSFRYSITPLASGIQIGQPLAVAKHDLTGT